MSSSVSLGTRNGYYLANNQGENTTFGSDNVGIGNTRETGAPFLGGSKNRSSFS